MAIIDFARDDPRMITANFGLAEFQCPPTCGCNAQLIDDDLIKRRQTNWAARSRLPADTAASSTISALAAAKQANICMVLLLTGGCRIVASTR